MCLDIIETKYPKGIRAGVGYKVFYSYDKRLFGDCFSVHGKERPTNVWLKEKDYRENTYKGEKHIVNTHFETYLYGFHVFLNLKDAQGWCLDDQTIKKIQYRKARASGYQVIGTWLTGNLKTIVAREIKILDEEIK